MFSISSLLGSALAKTIKKEIYIHSSWGFHWLCSSCHRCLRSVFRSSKACRRRRNHGWKWSKACCRFLTYLRPPNSMILKEDFEFHLKSFLIQSSCWTCSDLLEWDHIASFEAFLWEKDFYWQWVNHVKERLKTKLLGFLLFKETSFIKSSYYMNDSNDDELLHYVNIVIAYNCFVFWFVHPFVFGPHIS